jgi:hypothetical protein
VTQLIDTLDEGALTTEAVRLARGEFRLSLTGNDAESVVELQRRTRADDAVAGSSPGDWLTVEGGAFTTDQEVNVMNPVEGMEYRLEMTTDNGDTVVCVIEQ